MLATIQAAMPKSKQMIQKSFESIHATSGAVFMSKSKL